MESKRLKKKLLDLKEQQDEIRLELGVARILEDNETEVLSVNFGEFIALPLVSPSNQYTYKLNLNGETILSTFTISHLELISNNITKAEIVKNKREVLRSKLIDSMVDEFRKFLERETFTVNPKTN